MNIRTATLNDLDAVTAVEAACFPAAEAASKEEFAERLRYYGSHFWLMLDGEKLTYITTSNLYWDRFVLDNLKTMPFTDSEVDKCYSTTGRPLSV